MTLCYLRADEQLCFVGPGLMGSCPECPCSERYHRYGCCTRYSVIVSGLSSPFTVAVVVASECQASSFMALYFHGWINGGS